MTEPLGTLLLREGRLKPDDLEQVRRAQREEGGRFADTVLKLRLVSEDDLAAAHARLLGLEALAELRPEEVDIEIGTRLPIAFAKQHRVLPVRRDEDGAVVAAIADPLDVATLDDVRGIFGVPVVPQVAAGTKVLDWINKVYARRADGGVELSHNEDDEFSGESDELVDILDLTDEAPIIRWVNSLIFNAVKERASDIHIEPGEKEVVVRYRIDGVLYEARRANRNYLSSIIARVKIMAGLNIAEKRLPQDGRIRRRIAGKDIDMRVATAPTSQGERVTIRLLDPSSVLLGLADLGFADDHLTRMEELIRRPHGILLVTGPTGSGKTTTLYACLSSINSPDLNILTIEDPVEYQLEGISQTQVNPKIDLTFATGLRSFLRHDPDVIMVGEIRDLETAEIAIHASLTGHLVFSTIHTNDAAGGITRLVDMGVEPFLVASSLLGLLAQRLIRRLCPECRQPHRPTEQELESLGLDFATFARGGYADVPAAYKHSAPPPAGTLYRPRGCPRCMDTGYTGRLGIYELLLLDDEVRNLALKNTDSNTLRKLAVGKGMRTLRQDGARKVLSGITSVEEVLTVTQEDAG